MAFKFNWSPLTTDAGFYTRAQELLTAALNKSPRPPIIVDDFTVNELNLGHVPPELEILEIGDLAEDRFRGIFKMSYNGDAFLTLKTKVQANPLNTFLSTRDAFASPRPLAAATGLTIPLQITLSDIKLSAFIVLVFSRQKGLTLVFRNDPLESLKVSSTFDSIPFVRDYLQKEIDGQLRILLMDQLPAIIHRLSLRLWSPEYRAKDDQELAEGIDTSTQEPTVDPLASPPQDPVDSTGNPLNASDIASLSLDSIETQSLFSQKNLLRLAALNDSHRTLSLFTPGIRDTVFRAWAMSAEKGESVQTSRPPTLNRSHSYAPSTSTTYTFQDDASLAGRSVLSSGSGMASGRSSGKPHRKRKKRVVNLRKKTTDPAGDGESVFSGDTESYTTESVTESESSAPSVFSPPPPVAEESVGDDGELLTPPPTLRASKNIDGRPMTAPSSGPQRPHPRRSLARAFEPTSLSRQSSLEPMDVEEQSHHTNNDLDDTPRASRYFPPPSSQPSESPLYQPTSANHPLQHALSQSSSPPPQPPVYPSTSRPAPPSHNHSSPFFTHHHIEKPSSPQPLPAFLQFLDPGNSASIGEQAWMMKMANDVATRYRVEKSRILETNDDAGPSSSGGTIRERRSGQAKMREMDGEVGHVGEGDVPPPAYAL